MGRNGAVRVARGRRLLAGSQDVLLLGLTGLDLAVRRRERREVCLMSSRPEDGGSASEGCDEDGLAKDDRPELTSEPPGRQATGVATTRAEEWRSGVHQTEREQAGRRVHPSAQSRSSWVSCS